MALYRFQLMARDRSVGVTENISAETTGEALSVARVLSAKSAYSSYELWDANVLIYRGVRQMPEEGD